MSDGGSSGPRDADTPEVVVGLLADPEFSALIASHLAATLPGELTRRVSSHVRWKLVAADQTLTLDEHGRIPLQPARRQMADRGWDIAIVISDLPQRSGWEPVVTEADHVHGVALASLPTLGGARLRHRTRETVLRLIRELAGERWEVVDEHGPLRRVARRVGEFTSPTRTDRPDDEEVAVRVVATGIRGRLRLLGGLVRANRPWRMAVGMSSLLVAALATAAYAQVSSTVWEDAAALGIASLVGLTVASIALMVAWLVVDHNLWDRRDDDEPRAKVAIYNTATVLSMGIGVACLYVALFMLVLFPARLVIASTVFGSFVRHHVGWRDYVALAWLASSLGTVAGALGSGLDNDEVVKRAAFGRRERQRRADVDAEADNGRAR
jgi:hypothetical protein